ncbi:SRPBCC domain-containing protein [Leifsonia sp. 1010]|uniref:SRPBCC domain-containing protein n=1 Tax=Leifsonia sp. 1010 TaxID=2817769 RepID=UPI002854BECE|nr:SRPBCC domain-containing protein [Leifsonia sp. 1010]MDR6610779.1 uncharacterized protein YndB with AHSA1/START domain [Leifsonia sp. 1010]
MVDVERSIVVRATQERVWAAIVDSKEFGAWFGAEFDGPFEVGRTTTGRIVPTTVDAEVAAAQEPHRGSPIAAVVIAIEPPTRFAFRWQPAPGSDVLTTVEFRLAAEGDGVRVTITEDGFGALPEDIRDQARESNDGGWEAQTRLLGAYLERTSLERP